jgi:hypothetical protein
LTVRSLFNSHYIYILELQQSGISHLPSEISLPAEIFLPAEISHLPTEISHLPAERV